jgi:dTDP-4-dehydrorhamnose reductase
MPFKHDRIIITGGGGMLAKALSAALQRRGVTARALGRNELDVAGKAKDVIRKVLDLKPTLILNCAAYTKVDDCEREGKLARQVNGFSPAYLAAAAGVLSAKLVHFSTDFVFDGTSQSPYRPDDKPNPLSAYGASKLLGERMLLASRDVDHLIIRTAWLYGLGGASFPKTMLDVARAGKPLRVVNDQVGAPTFTDDLADATLDLVERDARGIVHVTNSGQTTWFDFARAIFEEFELSPDLQPITSADWKALKPQSATRPAYSVLDLSEFERITGRTMRPWREGLRAFRQAT